MLEADFAHLACPWHNARELWRVGDARDLVGVFGLDIIVSARQSAVEHPVGHRAFEKHAAPRQILLLRHRQQGSCRMSDDEPSDAEPLDQLGEAHDFLGRDMAADEVCLGMLGDEAQNLLELEQRRAQAEQELRAEREALQRLEERLRRLEQNTPPNEQNP